MFRSPAASSRRRSTRPFVLAFSSIVVAPLSLAQPAPDATITVTATRTPLRVDAAVAEVTVIERAAIERAAGRTLVELLASQPGLQLSSNGGLGKTASLFMRGLEARHTLLLVDGVRVGSATVGSPSLDNLPLSSIERIEIVRGPMSSLYGAGAMGGVVQVFTRRGAAGSTSEAKATIGSHGYAQLAGGGLFGSGAFDAAVQLQRTVQTGVSASNPKVLFDQYNDDRDGFRQTGGSLRLGWQPLADWRFELLTLQSRGETQLDDGPGADARARLTNGVVSLAARGRVSEAWRTRVALAESRDVYDTLSSASAFASLGPIESKIRQIGWENQFATPVGTALVLAERQTEKVSRPGAPFDVSERDIDGLAFGLDGGTGAHTWQGSLRHDHNSQFGGLSTGAAGYAFALTPAWRLGASGGTSFVAPSFNQLYYPSFGNPKLEPEKGRHAELSLRWSEGGQQARAAVFRNRYRGFITSGRNPINLPYAQIEGYALSWEGRWQALAAKASLDHVDPRNDTTDNPNFDKQLPRRAKDALRLEADWQPGAWAVGATLAMFSHRFDDAANTARLAGYATLDLRAEWAASREWQLGARLNNAGDQRYETSLGYDQPRRELFLTARYTPK